MFYQEQQQESVPAPLNFEGGIYTLGVGYHPNADACSVPKDLTKSAKLQDFGYAIKGELLKQHYSVLHSSYKKSTLCGMEVEHREQNGTAKLKYDYLCRQKWCPRCNRIRAAELITSYVPIIAGWKDLYMVTLTQKNVQPGELKSKLDEMQRRFRNIFRTMHRRFGTSEIKAIKTIEVTANVGEKTLHPHYHVLLESKEAALMLRELWMERSRRDGDVVVWAAQEVNRVNEPEVAAKEIFKYLTKFLVKSTADGKLSFSGWLLDKIYVGTRRKHLVQTFGFTAPEAAEETDDGEYIAIDADGVPTIKSTPLMWVPEINNYIKKTTGEIYSNHRRSHTFMRIISIIKKGEDTPTTR